MPQTKDDDLRGRLLDIANRHFAKEGYTAANLSEIAQEAGVTRGPLYYYFSNKAELYRATVEKEIEEMREAYAAILAPNRPVLDVIREDFLYCLKSKGLFSRVGSGGKGEPDLSEMVRTFNKWLLRRKYEVFAAAKESGELPESCDLSRLITFIYVYYYGVIQTRRLAQRLDGFNADMLESSVDFFMDTIRDQFINA